MKAVVDTVKKIISPEQNWSQFLMKIIGVGVVAGIGFAGFQVYTGSQEEEEGPDDSIEVIFDEIPEKKLQVEEILNDLTRSNRDINSVWLYDWPDARNIVPVFNSPQYSRNPLPSGYWMPGDERVIGNFVLGSCTRLDRKFPNAACPIMGKEDAWGVLVVEYAKAPEDDPLCILPQKSCVRPAKVASMKISEILYLLENKK